MKVIIFLILLGAAPSIVYADCHEDSISSPTPFMGNDGEIFKLASGSIWEVKYEYEYLYAYNPQVVICPEDGKLIINGKALQVENVSNATPNSNLSSTAYLESQIDGDFNGWEGETIYKLMNGQVWQQAAYYYHYFYKYSPKVIIYKTGSKYFMQVEGVDKPVQVVRLQ